MPEQDEHIQLTMTVVEPPTIFDEIWDDPGDYPSNAGAGPLPSYEFECLRSGGEFRIDLNDELIQEMCEFLPPPRQHVRELDRDKLHVKVVRIEDGELVLCLEEDE